MQHLSNKKYELLIAQAYAGAPIQALEINELCLLLDKTFDMSNIATAFVVADLHHYRMRQEEGIVKKAMTRRDKKPFEFFLNIN
jgi:hypothetical protein